MIRNNVRLLQYTWVYQKATPKENSNGEPKMAPGIEDQTARTFELKEHP